MRTRAGITTIAFVMILLVAISIAGTSIFLSRSAGRSTVWFLQAQRAQDFASTGLKVVLAELEQRGVAPDADAKDELGQLVTDLRDPKPLNRNPYTLLSSEKLPAFASDLREQLSAYGEGAPSVTVKAKVFGGDQLWQPNAEIPMLPDPRERRGFVQLTSSAWTTGRDGRKIGRTLILERDFKTVSIRPPLLGRFSLFSERAPTDDPNQVRVRYDAQSGDGVVERGPQPLVVTASKYAEMTNGTVLRPDAVFNDALKQSGWIYLGAAPSGSNFDWTLNLAHGYSNGDTAQLPGFVTGSRLLTGYAVNAEAIGTGPTGLPGIDAPAPDAAGASLLQLFGTGRQFAPALVFGQVQRRFKVRSVTPPAGAPTGVPAPASPAPMPPAPPDAAGSSAPEPYVYALEHVMFRLPGGDYLPSGLLKPPDPVPAPAGGTVIPCEIPSVAEWLKAISQQLGTPGAPPPPQAGTAFAELWRGEVQVPSAADHPGHAGTLGGALKEFVNILTLKAVYSMKASDASDLFARPDAKVPGILYVTDVAKTGPDAGFALGPLALKRGGIILVVGSIRITGDIEPTPHGPLTLVSIGGNIDITPSASRVSAHLVAPDGTVRWPGACTITGGVAAQELDLKDLVKNPAPRTIVYDGKANPFTKPDADTYQVMFGGDDRLAVLGAEDQ